MCADVTNALAAVGPGAGPLVADDLRAVVVTYQRPDDLRVLMTRLAEQTVVPSHLVVVDNDADEECRRIVESAPLAASYVTVHDNLGPAGGLRLGIRRALADGFSGWVLLLDDDNPPIRPDDIERVRRLRGPGVGGVGLTGARFDRRTGTMRRFADAELSGVLDVDYIPGNHLPMYSTDALAEVGGPSPRLFFGYEELELGLRVIGAGWRLVVDGDEFLALRKRFGTTERDPIRPESIRRESPWRRFYSVRNMLLVLAEHGSRTAMVRSSARALLGSLRRVARRDPGSVGLLWSTIVGLAHGWSGRSGRTLEPGDLPRWRT